MVRLLTPCRVAMLAGHTGPEEAWQVFVDRIEVGDRRDIRASVSAL